MSGIIEKVIDSPLAKNDYTYVFFRILVGFLFMAHGAQKILAAFGGINGSGISVPVGTLIWWAGIIELFGGGLIILGLFTRLAALVAAIEMLVAFFMVHFPQEINPLLNGGELALLFFLSFLLIAKKGAKNWSLERILIKREIF